jgi:hypothetical protein
MMKRIHIVGCGPRTGTTLLTEMMISSYNIDVYTDHEDRIAKPPKKSGKVFLTKSPKDIMVVGPVLKMMKNLHVILMLRDPRDSIVSMHGTDKERYWSNLHYWKNFMPFAEELTGHPRFLVLRYEDLASDPNGVQAKISAFLPFIEEKHKFSEYHQTANPSSDSRLALGSVRPVSSKSIGNWRNHKARIVGQLLEHGSISDDLIKYGYEKDKEWEKELEGVEPDLRESHASDFYKLSFIRKKQRGKYVRAIRVWFYHTPLFLWLLDKLGNRKK